MRFRPLTLRQANDFVERWHRHSSRSNNDGGKFAIGVEHDGQLVGVAICGRPVARLLQQDGTAEIVRCCVSPAAPKGTPSALYQRCARIWQLMGGDRIVTYTLAREGGESMRNLERGGWQKAADVPGGRQWDTPSRRRDERAIYEEPKGRHERALSPILPRSTPPSSPQEEQTATLPDRPTGPQMTDRDDSAGSGEIAAARKPEVQLSTHLTEPESPS